MIKTKERIIEGDTYTVTQLPARRALRLKTRLIKTFGSFLTQISFVFDKESSEEKRKEDIVKAIEVLASNIDENTMESIVLELIQGVRKNGVELTSSIIDLEFAGDMKSLYLLIFFVIEVNFANFFYLIGITSLFDDQNQTQEALNTKKSFMKS